MRIGLAGAGRIGAFHASTLAALDDVEQIVVADAFPAQAARLAAEHGYEELVTTTGVTNTALRRQKSKLGYVESEGPILVRGAV